MSTSESQLAEETLPAARLELDATLPASPTDLLGATLAGRCVYVTLTPSSIEADGETAVLTCAYMGATEAEGTTP